jgi:hypothetical protein
VKALNSDSAIFSSHKVIEAPPIVVDILVELKKNIRPILGKVAVILYNILVCPQQSSKNYPVGL